MARRPSSGSRSSSTRSARTGGGTGRTSARPARDGKVDIYCPQCGAHYRIAETSVDSKVTCADCKRTFFAKTTVGKRARKPDNTKVYVGFGIGAVFIVGTLIALSGGGDDKPTRTKPVVAADNRTQLELDKKLRRDQLLKWAGFVEAGQMYGLRQHSDLPALAAQLGVSESPDADGFEAAFLAALKANDCTRLFYEMKCTAANVTDEDVENNGGTATMYFAGREGIDYIDAKAGAQIDVQWQLSGANVAVTGFAMKVPPILRGRRPGDKTGETFTPSEDVERPEIKEIQFGGQTIKVPESPPVPLGHMKDTPPEMQKQIDDTIADLLRLVESSEPTRLNRARLTLAQLTLPDKPDRKPAVPRILNAMHDCYADVMANNQKLLQLTETLFQATGMELAYPFRDEGDLAKLKAKRESVVRQWFAWWWRYANDTHQEAIDQEEDLDAPPATGKDGK